MQVVQIYLQPSRRNSLLKCVPQLKMTKKPKILYHSKFKVIQGHQF